MLPCATLRTLPQPLCKQICSWENFVLPLWTILIAENLYVVLSCSLDCSMLSCPTHGTVWHCSVLLAELWRVVLSCYGNTKSYLTDWKGNFNWGWPYAVAKEVILVNNAADSRLRLANFFLLNGFSYQSLTSQIHYNYLRNKD